MTLRVNREIGFQVASTHEFPEGGAAVSLDGGSHFYEHQIVKGLSLNWHCGRRPAWQLSTVGRRVALFRPRRRPTVDNC